MAELARDLYGPTEDIEAILDENYEPVGYFMSLAARERFMAVSLGFQSADELPPEARGPYLSVKQVLARLERLAPSTEPTDAAAAKS